MKKRTVNIIFSSFIFLLYAELNAQLGACTGNSGDAIFTETFGVGGNTSLPAGTTSYSYGVPPNDGFYVVSSNSNYFDWFNLQDITPNDTNGRMLIVNSDFSPGEFYNTTITGLCENTTYEFSSWLINLTPLNGACGVTAIPINVKFEIWDATDTTLLASGDTGNIGNSSTPNWQNYALVFQTNPGETSVVLRMRNNGVGGCGNDLAIDDIVFKSCGDNIIVEDTANTTQISICDDQLPYNLEITANPDFSVFTTHVYQWQQSIDNGVTWTDIVGETNQTLTTSIATANIIFRAKVAEDVINLSNPQCITLSDVFTVNSTVVNPPTSNGDVNFNCTTNEATLSVTVPTTTVFTANWYDAPTNGTLLQANSTSYTATTVGTYYAEMVDITTGCTSNTRVAVSTNIVTPNAPTSNGDVTFNCITNEATLTVTIPTGTSANWYDSPTNGTLLQANSTSYTATTVGTYYAEMVDITTGCTSNTRVAVSTNIVTPNAPTSNGDVIFNCTTNEATLTVTTPTGTSANWYNAPTNGTLLQTNSTSYTATTIGTYYAETVDATTGCTSNTRVAVSTNIVTPNAPTSNGDVIFNCTTNEATLTVTTPTGTSANWYNAPTNGTLLQTNSTSYTATTIGTYYAETVDATTGCTSNTRVAVSTSIVTPNAPTSNGDVTFNCTTNEATLTVTTPTGTSANWYDSPTNGTLLQANSTSYTATTVGTYYAETVDITTGCTSNTRVAVSTSIVTPNAPTSNGDVTFNCTTNEATLTVTTPTGTSANWYDSPTNGTLLQANSTSYTATTVGTYYAETVDATTGCASNTRVAVSTNIVTPNAPTSNGDVIFNCTTNEATLTVTTPTGTSANWYNAPTNGTLLQTNSTSYTATTIGTYYAETVDATTGCASNTRVAVSTNIVTPNAPTSNGDVIFNCIINEATLTVTIPTGTSANWYDSPTNGTLLQANSTSYTATTIGTYYAETVDATTGCTSNTRVAVLTSNISPQEPISNGDQVISCINTTTQLSVSVPNGITANWYDSPTNGTLLQANSTTYTATNVGIYYVEAINQTTQCVSNTRVAIEVLDFLPPTVTNETTTICENATTMIYANTANVTSYLWNNTGETTSSIEISEAGIYTVTVTNALGCSSEKTITVTQIDNPVINSVFSEGNSILITTTTLGNFDYSLNGTSYQSSNVFLNVEGGKYNVHVRERSGCGIAIQEYIHFIIPQYFTPNNDGIHDYFEIKGIECYPTSEGYIFNRFGKVLYATKNAPFIWDGTYNGKKLPTSDYWYTIMVEDKKYVGHFTLKQ